MPILFGKENVSKLDPTMHGPVTVDLNESDIASFLGLKQNDIESQVTFYGKEPNGTLNSRTTP